MECQCEGNEIDGWSSCNCVYTHVIDCECNKSCKFGNYLDIRICSCKKRVVSKLVLKCENEILNTNETLLDDKKVTF